LPINPWSLNRPIQKCLQSCSRILDKNCRFVFEGLFVFLGIFSQPREIVPRGNLAEYENLTISLFNAAAPSIVFIFTGNAESGFFGRR
jgi:hypothetical protein